MDQKVPRHEKIRFRRGDITGLHTLPSALGQEHWTPRRSPLSKAVRICGAALGIAVSFVLLLVVGIYFVGITGISTDGYRDEAERAVENMLGVDVVAALGQGHISFDRSRFLALEVEDVSFSGADGEMLRAGSVRFGLRALPLLMGQVQLGSARIADARLSAGALPQGDGAWIVSVSNPDGLLDPDLVARAVFAAVNRGLDAVGDGSTRLLELANVEVLLPQVGGSDRQLLISHARLRQTTQGTLEFTAQTVFDGRNIDLEGQARRDLVTGRIADLQLTAAIAAGAEPAAPDSGPEETRIGGIDIKVSGEEGIGGEASRLAIAATVSDSAIRIDPRTSIRANASFAAAIVTGTSKVEIERGRVVIGRSRYEFHGAVGPRPHMAGADNDAVYRYELVSDSSTVMPGDSPEAPLDIAARVAGTYDPAAGHLEVDQIGIRSAGGELLGKASFDFVEGKAPGMMVALTIPRMPVAHVKQLWPSPTAGGARNWVMNNLFGGRVHDSSIQYRVPPGRLGNGVPLSADEVFGHFELTGSRFDVTGRIPPVRDAVGAVDFRGNDIDISLASGTVYLPSGKTVAASDGTLIIRQANVSPTIGKLDMDVAGSAEAITELASYDPINAMKHIGMTADEFSGEVSGNVKADIPLFGVKDTSKLGWLVALDFTDLALSRPFDGQLASEANGSIVVDPSKAVIKATAKLNGAPAEIELTEPIGGSGVERQRRIALVLDDKAREAIAPGLSTLLDGPVKVVFGESGASGARKIEADLTDARLDIPWAGWSKGRGVGASATFTMETSGDRTKLGGFVLSGKTFEVAGEIALIKGDLSTASFSTAQLNRGDDVSVSVRQSGKGYAVRMSGKAVDARAMIKKYLSDSEGAAEAAGAVPITFDADVDLVRGFGDINLSGVTLTYSGAGARIDRLEIAARAPSGGTLKVDSATKSGRRSVGMTSNDAGAVLRFLDIYPHMEGGSIRLALAGDGDRPMIGQVDTTDFWIVNEPRLASMVSSTPPGDQRSLNQAVRRDIDTSRVKFERGSTIVEKAPGSLKLERGVLRGPLIGLIFQGTLYDRQGNMDMTGTFMPAYGLNRIFGEIPLFGQILGNGRDRGLIGVTFRLSGDANAPRLQINPLSVIAPGIFRSIFEYN